MHGKSLFAFHMLVLFWYNNTRCKIGALKVRVSISLTHVPFHLGARVNIRAKKHKGEETSEGMEWNAQSRQGCPSTHIIFDFPRRASS